MESDTKKLTDTTKLLRECDAGTKMAISSINEILEKVEDTKLSEILTKSRNAHEELESEIHSLLNYHKEEQKEPDPIAKGMSFIKTNVKMGIDESDKTVANLITDGCNMGIKSLNKYLNQYAMADVISKKITEKLIRLEENLRKEQPVESEKPKNILTFDGVMQNAKYILYYMFFLIFFKYYCTKCKFYVLNNHIFYIPCL